jgi:hypothetical protein
MEVSDIVIDLCESSSDEGARPDEAHSTPQQQLGSVSAEEHGATVLPQLGATAAQPKQHGTAPAQTTLDGLRLPHPRSRSRAPQHQLQERRQHAATLPPGAGGATPSPAAATAASRPASHHAASAAAVAPEPRRGSVSAHVPQAAVGNSSPGMQAQGTALSALWPRTPQNTHKHSMYICTSFVPSYFMDVTLHCTCLLIRRAK